MFKVKSCFSLVLLLSIMCISRTNTMEEERGILAKFVGEENVGKAKLALGIGGAAALGTIMYAAGNNPAIQSMGLAVNLNTVEIQTAIALMGGLAPVALLGNEEVAQAASSILYRTPFYTLLIAGVYSEGYKNLVSYAPFVGQSLARNNKIAQGYSLIAGAILMHYMLNKGSEWLYKHLGISDSDDFDIDSY